jgi:hypothetical protein
MSRDPFGADAPDEFMSGGAIAAKWPEVGFVVEGPGLSWEMQHQNDYETGEPLYWEGKSRVIDSLATDKSKPVMQMAMDVQCEPTGITWAGVENEKVEVPDDDGVRTLYVKAGLHAALKAALRKADGKLAAGARVKVTRIKDGPKSNPRYRAPFRFEAEWTPPAPKEAPGAEFLESGGDNPFG